MSPKPQIYMETNASGQMQFRVEEQRYTPDSSSLAKSSLESLKMNFDDIKMNVAKAPSAVTVDKAGADVNITNLDLENQRLGIAIKRGDETNIYNVKFSGFADTDYVYGNAIRLGVKGVEDAHTTGTTYIQRVYADGEIKDAIGENGTTYATSNKDFFGAEDNNGLIYVRDVTAHSFSDASFDIKGGNTVYIMNATLSEVHRAIRAHEGAHIVLVNCKIDAPAGQKAIWMGGPNSKVEYFNCLFNGESTLPASLVQREDPSVNKAMPVKLDYNPLAKIDFFKTDVQQVHVETSTDGKNWVEMAVPTTGDNLYDVDLSGNYYVRSYYTLLDGSKSNYSDIAHHSANGTVEYLPSTQITPLEFTGTDNADEIDAGDNGSIISTGNGMDIIHAGAGADYIDGGNKNDTVLYDHATKGVTVDLLDSSANAGDAKGDTLINIERIYGSDFGDRLLGSNGENWLQGGDGNDYIDGRDGNDRLVGNEGNDTLVGGAGTDRLQGGEGNDRLAGGEGADVLQGGNGADSFVFTKQDLGSIDTIADFSTKGGDSINLRQLFDTPLPTNNHINDYVHIMQQGKDAVLQVDVNGQGHFTNLAVITNGANSLAHANLVQLVNDGVLHVV